MRITFLAYVVVTALAFYETAHGSRQMWRRGGGHTQLGFRLSFTYRSSYASFVNRCIFQGTGYGNHHRTPCQSGQKDITTARISRQSILVVLAAHSAAEGDVSFGPPWTWYRDWEPQHFPGIITVEFQYSLLLG